MVLHKPKHPSPAVTPEVTKVSIWLCSPVWTILLPFVLLDRDIPKQKKRLEMANERSDKEKEAHWDNTIRGQRLGFTGSGVWWGQKKKKSLFPVKFCALDSAFGALHAAAYTSEVQQGASSFLQFIIQLGLDLASWPLTDGPLDGGRTTWSLVDAPLVPKVGVLVAVEALAAGAAGLPAFTASFIQGGERRGGGTGGAALQGYTAVVVVLLWIAAHQDRVGSGEV